jgi:hypothetical protein
LSGTYISILFVSKQFCKRSYVGGFYLLPGDKTFSIFERTIDSSMYPCSARR